MNKVADRVFSVAAQQCELMAGELDSLHTPRSFDGTKLITARAKWWCSGFFPGTLWLVYEHTGDENIRTLAQRETAKVEPMKWVTTDHDVGFQINCSFGQQYRLTGDLHARDVMHTAARSLATRFNPTVGCIRSWDFQQKGSSWQFPVIIDNMMNLELLMSVSAMENEPDLSQVAVSHANTTMKNHYRPDYTTYHLVDYNPADGSVNRKQTVQGYADDSAWARGQAWSLYGFTMMYRFTRDPAYLERAVSVADMLLSRLPEDGIPYWDFDSPKIPEELRDASAAAVMASAFVELAGYVQDGTPYLKMAERQLRTLSSDQYLAEPGTNGGFILKHSVGNMPGNSEVDVPLTYADYYFLEAMGKYIAFSRPSVDYLTYEQFGAKGDGVTDDFPAIMATHAAANKKGLPVKATGGKTYYIGNTVGTAVVRTDVDFGTARFIIDDSKVSVEDREAGIFRVESALKPVTVKGVRSLKRGQTNIGKNLPGRCLVEVVDDNRKVYIRLGANQNSGVGQKEFFIADRRGNIDPASALVWDYDEITGMTAWPIDEKPLVIKGGIFTTIANRAPSKYTYYCRGIEVNRSNVRIENVTHYIEGEQDHGAPYDGFLSLYKAADIVVRGCVLTAHKTYKTIGSAGVPVSMGTYDISAHGCVNVKWENCRQTTDINDTKYWGIFVSNFCKALTLDHCVFSRFDAHQGVRNVTLTGCELGHTGVNTVGFGTLRIENCNIHRRSVVILRADYGSSWEGDIIVRDCKLIVPEGAKSVSLLSGSNSGKHDFGYTCYLPERIDIENLVIDDSAITGEDYTGPMLFGSFKRDMHEEGLYPYIVKGVVNLKNVTVASGNPLGVSRNPGLFKDYTINYYE
jgi:hypothetical protein